MGRDLRENPKPASLIKKDNHGITDKSFSNYRASFSSLGLPEKLQALPKNQQV